MIGIAKPIGFALEYEPASCNESSNDSQFAREIDVVDRKKVRIGRKLQADKADQRYRRDGEEGDEPASDDAQDFLYHAGNFG